MFVIAYSFFQFVTQGLGPEKRAARENNKAGRRRKATKSQHLIYY
jgi:hypothetical protein